VRIHPNRVGQRSGWATSIAPHGEADVEVMLWSHISRGHVLSGCYYPCHGPHTSEINGGEVSLQKKCVGS
jgi:hypothetical protein